MPRVLCSWAKHDTVGSVVSPNPGWVILVLLGDLSATSSSNSSHNLSRLQGGKQHPGRTTRGIRGSNKSLCPEDGHELAFLLLSIPHQEHIQEKNSPLYFFAVVKQITKRAFSCVYTGAGVGGFLYFSNLCLLLKPS